MPVSVLLSLLRSLLGCFPSPYENLVSWAAITLYCLDSSLPLPLPNFLMTIILSPEWFSSFFQPLNAAFAKCCLVPPSFYMSFLSGFCTRWYIRTSRSIVNISHHIKWKSCSYRHFVKNSRIDFHRFGLGCNLPGCMGED